MKDLRVCIHIKLGLYLTIGRNGRFATDCPLFSNVFYERRDIFG